jgi:hypothetical protein
MLGMDRRHVVWTAIPGVEAAMAAHFLRRHDFLPSPGLDWLLILAGALFAWLFWPATHP